ncbi:hypothetical protein [Lacrimispora sp.]
MCHRGGFRRGGRRKSESGECLMNTITPDGYRVDENGAWEK